MKRVLNTICRCGLKRALEETSQKLKDRKAMPQARRKQAGPRKPCRWERNQLFPHREQTLENPGLAGRAQRRSLLLSQAPQRKLAPYSTRFYRMRRRGP